MSVIERQLAALALARGDLWSVRAQVPSSIEAAHTWSDSGVALRPLHLAARLAIAEGQYALGVRLLAAMTRWQQEHQIAPHGTSGADGGCLEMTVR